MKLTLKRSPSVNSSTVGQLFNDGQLLCFTMEDQIRDLTKEKKVYGETAIPAGVYQVIVSMSNRFKIELPLLISVPQFEGIRIHPGNTKVDTDGCILPGVSVSADKQSVLQSRVAFAKVFALIKSALDNKQPVSIEIINP